ncbi:MAG: putative toxin-antitoxin system toxin component, PIN family [bacterium]|nr:putative toxin-antitoxin system toxin component, PIN family [bacterium]
MRVVFDTNVLIANALKDGFTRELLNLAITGTIDLLTSEPIISELEGKLKTKFSWEELRLKQYINTIREIALVIEPKEKITVIKTDPNDNKILECAVAGKANLIVSADSDLIKLKSFQGIGIVHPKTLSWTFPEYFKKNKS